MDRDESIMIDAMPQSLQKRSESEYCQFCLKSLQCYLDFPLVKYVFHHLKHTHSWCCNTKDKCINKVCYYLCQICDSSLCGRKYKSKDKPHKCQGHLKTEFGKQNDWQAAISSQILHKCCHINLYNQQVVHKSCQLKDELSPSTKHDGISRDEFDILLPENIKLPIHQGPSLQDDRMRLKRPRMDDSLNKETTEMSEIYTKLAEVIIYPSDVYATAHLCIYLTTLDSIDVRRYCGMNIKENYRLCMVLFSI